MSSAVSTALLPMFSSTSLPGEEQGGLHGVSTYTPFCRAGLSQGTTPSCKAGWERQARWVGRERRETLLVPDTPASLARSPGFDISLGAFFLCLTAFSFFQIRHKILFLWALLMHAITREPWFLSVFCSTFTLGVAKARSHSTLVP